MTRPTPTEAGAAFAATEPPLTEEQVEAAARLLAQVPLEDAA